MRLVPPRVGEVERRTRLSHDAQRWTHGLRAAQRRRLLMIAGNLMLLGVLVGLPFVRGYQRAQESRRAHAAFLACLYGLPVRGGLANFAGEAEYFAAQLAKHGSASVSRCAPALEKIAPDPALFVLPSVKRAEAHTREALAIVRVELANAATYVPGMRMPERALRTLKLLRATVRAQLVTAGENEEELSLPLAFTNAPGLPAPARLSLYAAADAALSVTGDDQLLRIVALDATGLSYLEADPGKPFSRARLVRPSLLRALVRFDAASFLVWATPHARCTNRSDGCFGKTMRIANAPSPLLELPSAQTLAAHLAGRADRSFAPISTGMLLAARAPSGRTQLQEFALPTYVSTDSALPASSARKTWPLEVDEALVLSALSETLVLGVTRAQSSSQLLSMSASGSTQLATLAGDAPTWLTACADDQRAGFAFGDGQRVLVGTLLRSEQGVRAQVWPELALELVNAIDPEHASRDRVRRACTSQGALLIARETGDRLSAVVCSDPQAPCRKLEVAADVNHFSLLATERGALIAYAGRDRAQVRVRSLDLVSLQLGPERIPAACWTHGGLCARPTLARLGRRILLVAPDKTDLLALESGDEGATWVAPSIL